MPPSLPIFSPIQQIHDPLFEEKQLQVFIKRDDMIHPFISGNKWRKLKYVLQKADNEGRRHLVTFGGAYSNHLLATAAAGAQFGFKTTGFVRGEEVQNDTLFLCHLHGMHLRFVSREAYRDKSGLFETHYSTDAAAFFIDEGGASPEAARGCSELLDELPVNYDHLFCACGTGATAAGLINGITGRGLPTLFHGISVFKNGEFLRPEIERYLTAPAPFRLHTEYHFGGYAKITPGLIQFIQQFTARTGIMIEPVYTAKMLYAVYDMARNNQFRPGSTLLAVHTGGLPGLLGMKKYF